MTTGEVWVVRADRPIADQVEKTSQVAIGWPEMGDLAVLGTREAFKQKYKAVYAESDMRVAIGAGQLYRFAREIHEGDFVLTPLSATREVLIGEATGDYAHNPGALAKAYPNVRAVKWMKKLSRDSLSVPLRNSLGGIMTVFKVSDHLREVQTLLVSQVKEKQQIEEPVPPFYEDVKAKADEMISDLLNQIGPYDFQELVAALLRAMGLRTRVSPRGPDGGVDIKAFPDALGFETPRIRVQVKHRKGPAGIDEVQQLAGATRSEKDKGLFVSTGGFTTQAKNEADKHPDITLLDRELFIKLLLEHYEKLEAAYQAKVPLKTIYIPAP